MKRRCLAAGKRLGFLLVPGWLVFLFAAAHAGPPPALLRVALTPTARIWRGQRLTLNVSLYTTIAFAGPTRFDLPQAAGMVVMASEDHPLLGREEIGGIVYLSKRHEIYLFPLRAGKLTVPPFAVEFSFRTAAGQVVSRRLTTPRLTCEVREVPGADPHLPLVTAADFRVEEQWQPPPRRPRVGDALTREVTLVADGLPGMLLPPLRLVKVDGLGLYRRQPLVTDRQERGALIGSRRETVTYVCERPGIFTIPAIEFQWWQPRTATLQRLSLPAVELRVVPHPRLTGGIQAGGGGFPWRMAVPLAAGLLFLAGLAYYRLRAAERTRQLLPAGGRRQEERQHWARFRAAARRNDAPAVLEALYHWLDAAVFTGSAGSLAAFAALAGDREVKKQLAMLESFLYAGKTGRSWSGRRLYVAVRRARKKLRRRPPAAETSQLPPLNP
ncbi:MAG: BatD family protein [Deltaproteobacteria bacterium]|nr:BatD family protein [Deltaproteobacteria bacterium]